VSRISTNLSGCWTCVSVFTEQTLVAQVVSSHNGSRWPSQRRGYCCATDRFERLDEGGEGLSDASLSSDVKTFERVAGVQARPTFVPWLCLQAVAKCLFEERQILRYKLQQPLIARLNVAVTRVPERWSGGGTLKRS
jgi:hypothetical protein